MSERFYLGSVPDASATSYFTLVVESPTNFYVECYSDSRLRFFGGRTKTIRQNDFKKYEINGARLDALVAKKFYDENFLMPEKDLRNPLPPQQAA